jgi:hypothetical protein
MLGVLSHLSPMQACGESITLFILLGGNLKITRLVSAKLQLETTSPLSQSKACSMKEKLKAGLIPQTSYSGSVLKMNISIILIANCIFLG